nr:hypothetical protein [Wenjunlia tyrosinilytica]
MLRLQCFIGAIGVVQGCNQLQLKARIRGILAAETHELGNDARGTPKRQVSLDAQSQGLQAETFKTARLSAKAVAASASRDRRPTPQLQRPLQQAVCEVGAPVRKSLTGLGRQILESDQVQAAPGDMGCVTDWMRCDDLATPARPYLHSDGFTQLMNA